MDSTIGLMEYIMPIDDLTEQHQAQWGIMTPQHMVEHLVNSIRMSTSHTAPPLIVTEEQLPAARRFLFSPSPFPRGIVNPFQGPELRPLHYASISDAQDALRKRIDEFYRFFSEYPDTTPTHPYFGHLTYSEWEHFHRKHFQHHFSQFGLVAGTP